MSYTWYNTPSLDEVKKALEETYKLTLYARTINGTHMLTQWTPMYIEVRWNERTYETNTDVYDVTVANNEHSKPIYGTGYHGLATLDEVIRQLSPFCKRRTVEQARLF